jgi:hypothetical protein
MPDIDIKKVIVHKVDHISNQQPRLSDMEAPLEADVVRLLSAIMTENRTSRLARNGKFLGAPKGSEKASQL